MVVEKKLYYSENNIAKINIIQMVICITKGKKYRSSFFIIAFIKVYIRRIALVKIEITSNVIAIPAGVDAHTPSGNKYRSNELKLIKIK